MKSVLTASSFVKEIFTVGYSKLFSMIQNLLERISRDTEVKGALPAINSKGKNKMIAAIETFQTSFLALCLGHLSNLFNTVFLEPSHGSVLSKECIARIMLHIQEEIKAAQLDGRLTLLVLRKIGKVLLLLAQRVEYQASTGPEVCQVIGPTTPSTIHIPNPQYPFTKTRHHTPTCPFFHTMYPTYPLPYVHFLPSLPIIPISLTTTHFWLIFFIFPCT